MVQQLTLVPDLDTPTPETVSDNVAQHPSSARAGHPAAWVHRSWRPGPPATRGRKRDARRMPRNVRALLRDERGAVTAEYAIVIMAAVAFAGLLVAIMSSSEIRGMLVDLVQSALGSAG